MAHRFDEEMVHEMLRRGYTRGNFLKMAGAAGLSALIVGCGGQVRPQTPEGQQAATGGNRSGGVGPSAEELDLEWPETAFDEPTSRVEIGVAHAWDPETWERQQQFDDLFMKRHPNIAVLAENTPWEDYLQKYTAQAAGGALPDLMYAHFSWAQQLIQQDLLMPLGSYIARQSDFDEGDFIEQSLVSYTKDGELYGLPYDEGPGILYYNKDVFDEAGMDYPGPEWTLDDLKSAAIELTSGKGPNKVYGYVTTPTPGDTMTTGPSYLAPFGAQYVNEPQETECLIARPEAVEAMEWWMELRLDHQAVPSPADVETMQGDPFSFGRVAMALNGSWQTRSLKRFARFKWDATLWPKGPEKHSTFSAGSCYGLTRDSAQREAAWIYLNEYVSTAGQTFVWASPAIATPSRRSVWNTYRSTVESQYGGNVAEVVTESLNTIATHAILDKPTSPEVSQKATAIWDRVISGSVGVEEGLRQVTATINPILAENA
jgi:multiple sugar transport system substrate-binding protein